MTQVSRCTFVTLVTTLILCPPSDARSQTACGVMPESLSGDSEFDTESFPFIVDFVNTSSLRNPLFEAWNSCSSSAEECFGVFHNHVACSHDFANMGCGNRRILNAMVLMRAVPRNGSASQTWFDYVEEETYSVERDLTLPCTTGGTTVWSSDISMNTIFDTPLLRRASIVAHEAEHGFWDYKTAHCQSCECAASEESCDRYWDTDDSANTQQAQFLEQALAHSDRYSVAPFVEFEGLQHANYILDGRFSLHPGFNLVEHPSASAFGPTTRRNWTFSAGAPEVDAAIFGSHNLDGAVTVIHSVTAKTSSDTLANLGACWDLRKYGGSPSLNFGISHPDFAGSSWMPGGVDFGHGTAACAFRQLTGTALDEQLIRPATNIRPENLGMVALRGYGNSSGLLKLVGEYRTIDRGAAIGNWAVASSDPSAPDGDPWDFSIDAPRGLFITGLGFSVLNGRVVGTAANFSLGPELEPRAGGNGGTSIGVLACPGGYVPIGVRAKSQLAPFGLFTVGYFALVCTDSNWLNGQDTGIRALPRTSYADYSTNPPTFYPATQHGQNQPPGTVERLCDLGDTLRGIEVSAGSEIDNIRYIICTRGNPKLLNVGGPGGTTVSQDCRYSPGPKAPGDMQQEIAPYLYFRSGDRLDSIAMGCAYPLRDFEGFESGSDFIGQPTLPANTLPDVRPTWVDVAQAPEGRGFGVGACNELDDSCDQVDNDCNGIMDPPTCTWSTPVTLRPWTRWRGPTPTLGTGPEDAIEGRYYVFANAAIGTLGSVYRLERSGVDLRHVPLGGSASVSFRYSMLGNGVGTLRLLVRRRSGSSTWDVLFSEHDFTPVAGGYRLRSFSLNPYIGSSIDLRFEASRRSAINGDIALDAINITTDW